MAIKKTFAAQVGSALGAAAARVEIPKAKRASSAKHAKAKTPDVEQIGETQQTATPQLSLFEEIEITAYLFAESRGFQGGSPEEDWLRAEREVLQRRAANA